MILLLLITFHQKNLKSILNDIASTIIERANENIDFNFCQVKKIPNSPSGKPQIIFRY